MYSVITTTYSVNAKTITPIINSQLYTLKTRDELVELLLSFSKDNKKFDTLDDLRPLIIGVETSKFRINYVIGPEGIIHENHIKNLNLDSNIECCKSEIKLLNSEKEKYIELAKDFLELISDTDNLEEIEKSYNKVTTIPQEYYKYCKTQGFDYKNALMGSNNIKVFKFLLDKNFPVTSDLFYAFCGSKEIIELLINHILKNLQEFKNNNLKNSEKNYIIYDECISYLIMEEDIETLDKFVKEGYSINKEQVSYAIQNGNIKVIDYFMTLKLNQEITYQITKDNLLKLIKKNDYYLDENLKKKRLEYINNLNYRALDPD